MTIVSRKISVYGDSLCGVPPYPGGELRAARIAAYASGTKFTGGYANYAVGGNGLVDNFVGQHAGAYIFPYNNDFPTHIQTVDDAEFCIIHLGGNDQVTKRDGTLLDPAATDADYLGSDGLSIAACAMQHIQYARSAGKKVVICGTPYVDVTALASGGVNRFNTVNLGIRMSAALIDATLFIATYGYPGAAGQPAAAPTDLYDGVHAYPAYHNAVSDYIAATIVARWGL